MTPLPRNTYDNPLWRDAYDVCLRFEHSCASSTPVRSGTPGLVCARMLGYMILFAPVDSGRNYVSAEVNGCENEEALGRLADIYISFFARCFKASKGRTPTPSTHPSRPSFDDIEETLKYLIEEAPQDHCTAKYKALIRDRYRCVLTGAYDAASYNSMESIANIVDAGGLSAAKTEAAHILPESTNPGISGENEGRPKHEYAASVWAVMVRYGNVLVVDDLNGSDINRLENVMTLASDKHYMFDSLWIWLESTGVPSCYKVESTKPGFLTGIPETVSFTTKDSRLPLPSPSYLALHAACAKVAHYSGVGAYADRMSRGLEDIHVLVQDGSSADALSYALSAA
ncbi:hypothetical protein JAAARDRAFT_402182 [Jaapia argillacea MUCL 33604]|uniref:HNH nuclease domain-containing protein n=1 Tax=Jaapia argillacea MUCL 33604 TaxID=933084 RepID=A0A067PLK4_9AGAM|nr:hypothetical protein JAAARDRAFT_402182 [Jaapia argillacea MUCL 33604]